MSWWHRFIKTRVAKAAAYILWVAIVFIATQIVLSVIFTYILPIRYLPLSQNVLVIAFNLVTYLTMTVVAIGVPYWVKKRKTTKAELGLSRSLSWPDIGWAILGFVAYFILTVALMWLAQQVIPGFNATEEQNVGISRPSIGLEMSLAFILFVVIGPFIEEALFRGYLHGKLRSIGVSALPVILIVSLAFGLAHGQLNVGVDTFALGLVMSIMREFTGSIWTGVLMHMIKNGIAFFLLFVML